MTNDFNRCDWGNTTRISTWYQNARISGRRYFICALVDVMEVRTTRVHDQTYQQIRESFRDPVLRF